VVAAVYGSLMMVSLAGGPSLIPSLVPKENLATANALETLTFTLSGVVGPMLAGLLIVWIGAPNVLLFDALSYLLFFAALLRIKSLRLPDAGADHASGPAAPAPPSRSTLLDVARFAFRNKVILSTTIMFAACNLGLGLLNVWLPILSDGLPGGGPELYGLLLGAFAVGEVIGSLVTGSADLSLPLGSRICLSQVLAGASLAFFFAGQSGWAVALALFLFGFFSAPLTIWAQTLRMQIIPADFRGRAFALLRTLMQSTPPIGGALAGPLLPLLGIPAMVASTALLVGLPGLLGYTIEELRQADARDHIEAPASATMPGQAELEM
jgi:MFS family permease